MGSTPPSGLTAMNSDFQAWILSNGTVDLSTTPPTYTPGAPIGGVQALVTALQDTGGAFVNPYARFVVGGVPDAVNPDDASSPIPGLMDDLELAFSENDPNNAVSDWVAAMGALWDSLQDYFTDARLEELVTRFSNEQQDDLDEEYGKLNSMFAAINCVNSDTRYLHAIGLSDRYTRAVAGMRADLYNKREDQMYAMAMQNVALIMESMKSKSVVRTQILTLRAEQAKTYIDELRQYMQDQINIEEMDDTWNLRMYEHASRALSAGIGGPVIPGHPNQAMEIVSGAASVIGALSPLIGLFT